MARLAKLINMPLLQELANIVSGRLHSLSLNMPLLADANCSRLWIVGSDMRFLNDVSTSFVEIDRVCAFLECLSTFCFFWLCPLVVRFPPAWRGLVESTHACQLASTRRFHIQILSSSCRHRLVSLKYEHLPQATVQFRMKMSSKMRCLALTRA